MRKFFIISSISFFSISFSQINHSEINCGFDLKMKKVDLLFPEEKRKRDEANLVFSKKNASLINNINERSINNYSGDIYEIPVVVHVLESTNPINDNLALTDLEIEAWINRANSMFATTFGNGFYSEGTGPNGGTVMPFKLVLAKRSPSCIATNGIIRYNASSLNDYDEIGIAEQNVYRGVKSDVVKKQLAPHWPESSYYNIYIVIGIDGQKELNGISATSGYPDYYDFEYDTFIKAATVKSNNDSTLAHEMGHAFGLLHTFQGEPNFQNFCIINNDCTIDGDKVCDTSPSRSYTFAPVPTNDDIDPCTGQNFDGTQYNIMNYTLSPRKFTEGQRVRAVLLMNQYRKNLLNSYAGKDISISTPSLISVIPAQCSPTSIANSTNYAVGPHRVNFGNINNTTSGYDNDSPSPEFYTDFTNNSCLRPEQYTSIEASIETPIEIFFFNLIAPNGNTNTQSNFRTKVWIDYDNNGSFDINELVINNITSSPIGFGDRRTISEMILPPTNSIKNTYLRMRVAVDGAPSGTLISDFDACSQLQYGQMEDYAVKILENSLGTGEIKVKNKSKLVYIKDKNILKLIGDNDEYFEKYQIFDMNGKLIQQGNLKSKELDINQKLTQGIYFIKYNHRKMEKFLVKYDF